MFFFNASWSAQADIPFAFPFSFSFSFPSLPFRIAKLHGDRIAETMPCGIHVLTVMVLRNCKNVKNSFRMNRFNLRGA